MALDLKLMKFSGKGKAARRPLRATFVRMAVLLPMVAFSLARSERKSFAAADQTPGAAYSVVITGLGGEPDYDKLIQGWGRDLYTVLKKNSVSDDHVFWLAAKKEAGVYAESREEQVRKLFDTLAARIEPADAFHLFLVGHGSFDEYDYRFNLPGPDLTAAQINELLGRIRAERQLVVNMTSSSGASLVPLRRKGRVVMTATSAGRERNFSQFARYFIEALQDPAADADKNQEVTALEAYRFASREVARFYQTATRLATEHAMIEDKGEGEGVREPGPDNGEGLLAASTVLVRFGEQKDAADSPEAKTLRASKRSLEEQIEALKYRKASMPAQEYSAQLEKLLLALSRTEQQIERLQKK
jgi:hypothetical protein